MTSWRPQRKSCQRRWASTLVAATLRWRRSWRKLPLAGWSSKCRRRRLSQFCGLPADGSLTDVDDKPPGHAPANASVFEKIAAVAEPAVADGQDHDRDSNHKPQSAARSHRVYRDRTPEAVHLQLQEEQVELRLDEVSGELEATDAILQQRGSPRRHLPSDLLAHNNIAANARNASAHATWRTPWRWASADDDGAPPIVIRRANQQQEVRAAGDVERLAVRAAQG